MPPKAANKEKAVKGDEAEELVLQYMKSTNRPYSSTDVANNLKGKIQKSAAQKIMATLAENDQLTVKTYGKQTVFVYNQTLLDVVSKDDLGSLEVEIKETNANLEAKRNYLRSQQSELSTLEISSKTKNLGAEIDSIQADNAKTLKALIPLRGEGDGPKTEPMSPEEMAKIGTLFNKWRKEWTDRRKVYRSLLGMLQDGDAFQNKAEFEDERGICPDDEEAKEVEAGEFCQQASRTIRRPVKGSASSGNGTAKKTTGTAKKAPGPTKRTSVEPEPSQATKKKKAKKE